MPKPQRDLAREQFWRQTLADWRTSGLSVRAFCEARDLRPTTFDYWKRELQRRDQAASPKPVQPKSTPRSAKTPSVEVRCPTGHVVCVNGVSLSELFAALATMPGDTAC
jgi:transposase